MQSNHNNVLPCKRFKFAVSFLCATALMLVSTGCSTLPLASTGKIINPAPADTGQYQVKMETSFGGSKIYKGNIDGPITIQTALERSGAIKKYRNMEIDLFRSVEGVYQPLKMSSIYSASKKMVRPETDYGLRAGDSILIRAKSENSIGQIMGSFAH